MKEFKKLNIIISILFIGLSLSCTDKSQTNENQENILWNLEEEYIKAHKDADHSKILSMWDENFLGWPSRLENSAQKNSGSDYLEKYFSKPMPTETKFRIEKQGIHIENNIAILHYRFLLFESSTRITHTWIKRGNKWYILGGMDWNE
ncbi:nuclear transport factor 2 family protein [Formosa agariphila]|uniref:nuclear transport factor 2 family protein n=1 Tax=Formosa agariphila TaxID=320324 RepID=UPI00056F8615|nr:nuclear transport factor 2 family protein [Formosa agariphila]